MKVIAFVTCQKVQKGLMGLKLVMSMTSSHKEASCSDNSALESRQLCTPSLSNL